MLPTSEKNCIDISYKENLLHHRAVYYSFSDSQANTILNNILPINWLLIFDHLNSRYASYVWCYYVTMKTTST